MTIGIRSGVSWLCVLALCVPAFAESPTGKQPSGKIPSGKKSPPTLGDVESKPENFLGSRLTLAVVVAPTSRPAGTGAELTVSADAKAPASRLRFLVAKSLANAVAEFKEPRRARLTGTVLAAESVRAGHTFEVDEIEVLDDADKVVATLKPTAGPLPTIAPEEKADEPKVATKEPEKSGESPKKSGATNLLMAIAGLMALVLLVLLVVGIRLMKHLKQRPAASQIRSPVPVARGK